MKERSIANRAETLKEKALSIEHFCHFGVRKFTVNKTEYTSGTPIGFLAPRIAYILSGECTIVSDEGEVLNISQGDVWFVPKGKPYTSYWKSDGVIEFYAMEFEADLISFEYTDFHVAKAVGVKACFEMLEGKIEKKDSIGALRYFYELLDAVLPLVKKEDNPKGASVTAALKYIHNNYAKPLLVEDLAAICYMSASRFYTVFKETVGMTPIEYKNRLKIARACMLIESGFPLDEVCEALNLSSPAFLRRLMKKHLGITPKEIKNRQPVL